MKKTIQTIVLAALCFFLSSSAQAQTTALKIGDQVPESFWTQKHKIYINGNTLQQDLSVFKGKLLILDFWAAWCGACISNFPKLELIQQQYPTQVKILKVSYQTPEQIAKPFLADIKNNSKPSYEHASVVNDTFLIGLFPNKVLPHYVWIGLDGIVKAITSGEQLTSGNIKAVIEGADKPIITKRDQDINKPLFLSSDLSDKNPLLSYSLLFKGYYHGLPSGTRNDINNAGQLIGKTVVNLPLVELYEGAVINDLFKRQGESYSIKKRIIEVTNKTLVSKDYSQPSLFSLEHYYSYCKKITEGSQRGLEEQILHELNLASGYTGKIEKRNIPCLVISSSNKEAGKQIQSKSEKPASIKVEEGKYLIRNTEFNQAVNLLNSFKKIAIPVIDESGIKGTIDLDITLDADQEVLRSELKSYGLSLEETNRDLKVFVLSNSPEKN